MKKNLPITNHEVTLGDSETIISTTDLKGKITYVNNTFIKISGFSEEELIGQNHNIVRHPDMPPAAFEDLWKTVKDGKTWTGIVKNRCKNGNHYWVEAFVTPVYQNNQLIGYQSVRNKAPAEKITAAKSLYEKLNRKELDTIPASVSLLNMSIRARLFSALFVAGILPFLGDILWSMGIISDTVMVSMAILSSLILLVSAFLLHATVLKPLEKMSDTLTKITSGDLRQTFDIRSQDEIGSLQLNIKILQARLQTIIGKISEVSEQNTQEAEQLTNSSQETADMVKNQHKQSQHLIDAVNDITNVTQEVVSHTEQAMNAVQEATEESANGKQVVSRVRKTINKLAEEINQSAMVISQLDAKSHDINEIIGVISGIAEQTNLLALNAAIEAARAGEQGRGFAVVADEVRTLAGRTQEATVEINSVVEALQSGVSDAVNRIEKGTSEAASAVEKVDLSESALDRINHTIAKITEMNERISASTVVQFEKSQAVKESMNEIGHVSKNILGIAQKNNQESSKMIETSNHLNKQFEVFKIK